MGQCRKWGWRLGFLLALWIALLPTAGIVSATSGPDPRVLERDTDYLQLQWQGPSYYTQYATGEDGRDYLLPVVPGWALTSKTGSPQLPYATALLALPPEGMPQLQVEIGDQRIHQLKLPIYPAPALQQHAISNVNLDTPLERWAFDPATYAMDLWAPSEIVTLSEVGVMRGQRLARLTFSPWQYRYGGEGGELQMTDAVTITLTFPETQVLSTSARREASALRGALQSLVLNPEMVDTFERAPISTSVVRPTEVEATSSAAARFPLRDRGIYALPISLLQSAGIFPTGGDPARVQVMHGVDELALYWDAVGQRFLFYAEPQTTRWADYEFYTVQYGTIAGLRMATRLGNPAGLATGTAWGLAVGEEDHHYDSLYDSPWDGDRWYWGCLDRPASWQCPQSASYALTLRKPATGGAAATLKVWLQGYTDVSTAFPDHRVSISVNGTVVGAVSWDGKVPYTATLSVPASSLRSGANAVGFSLPGGLTGVSFEGSWVDAFTLQYPLSSASNASLYFVGESTPHAYTISGLSTVPQVYDVTDPERPKVVTGGTWGSERLTVGDDRAGPLQYFVSLSSDVQTLSALEAISTLVEPAGADYIVVTPASFTSALSPLIALRSGQGYSPFVATTEAIYAAYGDGRMDPAAIHAFVSHAYATWTPQPAYLLLVGDGTWDPLNHLGTDTKTWLPPYLAEADPWLGEVPADNRYVAVDGGDMLPDLAIGRLPVNSLPELQAVVAKIVGYETEMPPGDWNTRHLFVVDDPETAYDFPAEATAVMPFVPVTHTTTLLLCPDDPAAPQSPFCGDTSQTRLHLLSEWNSGALVVNWVGHSAFQQWEHNRLFHTDDLPLLTNRRRLPVLVEMTCFTGNFAHPDPLQTAIDEAVVRLAQGGTVASWGSSGQGLGSDNTVLHRAFYQAAFGNTPSRLGDAITAAKAVIAGGSGSYMVDTYHLFGDPALSWHLDVLPWAFRLQLPLVLRGS